MTLVWPGSTAPPWSRTPLWWWPCGTGHQNCCWEPRWEFSFTLPEHITRADEKFALKLQTLWWCALIDVVTSSWSTVSLFQDKLPSEDDICEAFGLKIPNTVKHYLTFTVCDLQSQTEAVQQHSQSTSTFTHETNSNAEICQEVCLLYVSADCHCVCSSLRRSTPQPWTCGQWAAYLASSWPRNLFSLENLKLTKLTRFSRWMPSFALVEWSKSSPWRVKALVFTACKSLVHCPSVCQPAVLQCTTAWSCW